MQEEKMSTISRLWSGGHLPIRDGLYVADGRAYEVEVDPAAQGGLRVMDEFDTDAFLHAEPDWVTTIDITREVQLSETEGYLCCGEGSYGSEGFFARLGPARELLWVVYLEESNPFIAIEIQGDLASLRSSSGLVIAVEARGTQFRTMGNV